MAESWQNVGRKLFTFSPVIVLFQFFVYLLVWYLIFTHVEYYHIKQTDYHIKPPVYMIIRLFYMIISGEKSGSYSCFF